jgi:hypothetical protein
MIHDNTIVEPVEKPIDNVTVDRLDMCLRMCGIQIQTGILDKLIDIVELIEDKGGEVSLNDICDLQELWKQS